MEEVHLVTQGNYSDYRVCGAFSSEEKANEYINVWGGMILTLELDKFGPNYNLIKQGFKSCHVQLNKDRSLRYYTEDILDAEDEFKTYIRLHVGYQHEEGTFFCVSLAQDKETAIKIANEKLSQMLAIFDWTTNREKADEINKVLATWK